MPHQVRDNSLAGLCDRKKCTRLALGASRCTWAKRKIMQLFFFSFFVSMLYLIYARRGHMAFRISAQLLHKPCPSRLCFVCGVIVIGGCFPPHSTCVCLPACLPAAGPVRKSLQIHKRRRVKTNRNGDDCIAVNEHALLKTRFHVTEADGCCLCCVVMWWEKCAEVLHVFLPGGCQSLVGRGGRLLLCASGEDKGTR